MIYCYQGDCETGEYGGICCKCCDKKHECKYACYHAFIDEEFCLSEIRVDKDE